LPRGRPSRRAPWARAVPTETTTLARCRRAFVSTERLPRFRAR
jgi:hypothetical protein